VEKGPKSRVGEKWPVRLEDHNIRPAADIELVQGRFFVRKLVSSGKLVEGGTMDRPCLRGAVHKRIDREKGIKEGY